MQTDQQYKNSMSFGQLKWMSDEYTHEINREYVMHLRISGEGMNRECEIQLNILFLSLSSMTTRIQIFFHYHFE